MNTSTKVQSTFSFCDICRLPFRRSISTVSFDGSIRSGIAAKTEKNEVNYPYRHVKLAKPVMATYNYDSNIKTVISEKDVLLQELVRSVVEG